jgi:hypothetical protein
MDQNIIWLRDLLKSIDGRLGSLETKVEGLQIWKATILGGAVVVSALVSLVVTAVMANTRH